MSETIDTYKTIVNPSEGFFKDKGSKFLSFAFPVTSEDEIKEIQQKLRKKYYDARHHVFAWKLGIESDNFRSSDDGEPSNSSGPPILGQIRSYELSDILIVVVRYFGGTKLGIPGLINAYRTAAKEAIEENSIVNRTITQSYRISFSYEDMNIVMRKLKEENIEQINPKFDLNCSTEIKIRLSDCERIENVFNKIHNIKFKQI